MGNTLEEQRLAQVDRVVWRKWEPYLSARAWGTVREDYSSNGGTWGYSSHERNPLLVTVLRPVLSAFATETDRRSPSTLGIGPRTTGPTEAR